jgi:hypothetical protein
METELVFGLNVPATQGVHAEKPVALANVPDEQGEHAAAEDDPVRGLLVPRPQGLQALSA